MFDLPQPFGPTMAVTPGAAFARIEARYVVPDVIVKKTRNVWRASLNPEAIMQKRIQEVLLGKSTPDAAMKQAAGSRASNSTRSAIGSKAATHPIARPSS